MKFFTAILALLALPAFVLADFATTLSYDNFYDNPDGSLFNVACSNGANGLLTRGYTTFNTLPIFPYIGGAPAVAAWNSPQCGSCWKVTYWNPRGIQSSINVIAIDTGGAGFNVAQPAMDMLTNNQAVSLGRVSVTAVQVADSDCGM